MDTQTYVFETHMLADVQQNKQYTRLYVHAYTTTITLCTAEVSAERFSLVWADISLGFDCVYVMMWSL